jgi:hypothetical protein
MEILDKQFKLISQNLKTSKETIQNNVLYMNTLKKFINNEIDSMMIKEIQDLNAIQENLISLQFQIQEADSDLRKEIIFMRDFNAEKIQNKIEINFCGLNHKLKLFSKESEELIKGFEEKIRNMYNFIIANPIEIQEFKTLISGKIESLTETNITKIINNNISNNTNLIIGSLNNYQRINEGFSSNKSDSSKNRENRNLIFEVQIPESFNNKQSQHSKPIEIQNKFSSPNINIEKSNSNSSFLNSKRKNDEEIKKIMEKKFDKKYDSQDLSRLLKESTYLMRIRKLVDNNFNHEVLFTSKEDDYSKFHKIKIETISKLDLTDLLPISQYFNRFVIAENSSNNINGENIPFIYYIGGDIKENNWFTFLLKITKHITFNPKFTNVNFVHFVNFFHLEELFFDLISSNKIILKVEYKNLNESDFERKIKNKYKKIREEKEFYKRNLEKFN